MVYAALLRGINVGGNRKVPMKQLKALFETLGYTAVTTYLNSGNVIFRADGNDGLRQNIENALKEEFGFEIPALVLSLAEIKAIEAAVPGDWQNDKEAKTDVAYLFPEINHEQIIRALPVKTEYMDIRYVDGAVFWRIDRSLQGKSQLGKLAGHKLYKLMTIRNINTARHLAGMG